MLNKMCLALIFASTLAVASALGQSAQSVASVDRAAHDRIAALDSSFRFGSDDADASLRYDQLDAATNQLVRIVDDYTSSTFTVDDSSERIQERVRNVLGMHRPNPEYGDLPRAKAVPLTQGYALVTAFTVVRGPHNDIPFIRGYQWDDHQFRLAAAAGEDLSDYNMFTRELPSPVSGEYWLLAWGLRHTFNGQLVRFRVYSFDGKAFRTLWSPDDMLSARVQHTADGFVITHEEPRYTDVSDHYRLTGAGPVKVR